MSLESKIETLSKDTAILTETVRSLTVAFSKDTAILTEALGSLTAALSKQNEVVENALASTPRASAKGKTASVAKKKSESKPATVEDLRGVFGPYLAAGSDKATKKRLIETMKPILSHFGVDRITEIGEEFRSEALEFGKLLAAAYSEGGIDAAEEVRLPFMEDDKESL